MVTVIYTSSTVLYPFSVTRMGKKNRNKQKQIKKKNQHSLFILIKQFNSMKTTDVKAYRFLLFKHDFLVEQMKLFKTKLFLVSTYFLQ